MNTCSSSWRTVAVVTYSIASATIIVVSLFPPFNFVAIGITVVGSIVNYFFLPDPLDDCNPTSPLVLDLDGDGVEAGAVVQFDHEGDGFMEATRWANQDNGVLVWDRNGDGVINDGSEVFGNNTALDNGKKAAHGFAALAELDSNGDGVITAADNNFAAIRVMRWTHARDFPTACRN